MTAAAWQPEDRVMLTAMAEVDIRGPWHDEDRVRLTPKGEAEVNDQVEDDRAQRRLR